MSLRSVTGHGMGFRQVIAEGVNLRSIILTFASCVLLWTAHPGAARAQPIQGFYIDGGAGLRMAFPPRATSEEPGVPGTFELRQRWGYDTQFSVGYALGDGWRFELEGAMGRGAIKSVDAVRFPSTSAGAVQNLGFMVNALFDLDVRSPYVYPYLGLGMGYQSTRLDGFAVTQTGRSGSFSASGTTGAPAGQVIGGLSFPIPNMPGLSLTVDYRVMGIFGGGSFQGTSTVGVAPGSAPVAGTVKSHNQFDQIVMFGVRYAFNTPPPAPDATQPAPAAALQSYEVAFDQNQTTLTDRAQSIVRNAALASTRQGTTRIAVTSGGIPGAGTPGDPPALAERRANTVLAALVADGVPRNRISVLVPGDDANSNDPREQRVEIVTQ